MTNKGSDWIMVLLETSLEEILSQMLADNIVPSPTPRELMFSGEGEEKIEEMLKFLDLTEPDMTSALAAIAHLGKAYAAMIEGFEEMRKVDGMQTSPDDVEALENMSEGIGPQKILRLMWMRMAAVTNTMGLLYERSYHQLVQFQHEQGWTDIGEIGEIDAE